MGEHIFFEEELFMTKGKKFFLGMAVLLMGASLFVIGCETEVEVPGAPQLMLIDEAITVSTDDSELKYYLLDPANAAVKVIEVTLSGAGVQLANVDEIPSGKTVIFRSATSITVTPKVAAGLTVKGTVYVAKGANLVANTSSPTVNPVKIDGGVIHVGYAGGGTLSVEDEDSVTSGSDTALGNTSLVSINGGTLKITKNTTTLQEAVAALQAITKGTVDADLLDTAGTPTVIQAAVTAEGSQLSPTKRLKITSSGAEAGPGVLTVPDGLDLTVVSDDLDALTGLVVNGTAMFTAGTFAGLTGNPAANPPVAAVTVGATGRATFTAATFDTTTVGDIVINGQATFGATAAAVPGGDVKVGQTGWVTVSSGGSLAIAAGKKLTVAADGTVDVKGTLTLTGAGSGGGAKITGAGNVVAGNVSITGGANGGAWEAVGASTTIDLVCTSPTAVGITGTGTTPQLVGLVDDGALITLAKGHVSGDGAELTVTLATIDLSTKGGIVFPYVATTPAKLKLMAETTALGQLKLGSGSQTNTIANLTCGGHSVTIGGTSHVVEGSTGNAGATAGLIKGGASSGNDATITGKLATDDVTVKAGATLENSVS
jgi:hypothetical protein